MLLTIRDLAKDKIVDKSKSISEGDRSISISLSIQYIFNKSVSLVKGHIEVNINILEMGSVLAQLLLKCQKYIKEMFNPYIVWHSYFLILWQSYYGKRAKLLEKFYLQLWKWILLKYQEISVQIQTFTDQD